MRAILLKLRLYTIILYYIMLIIYYIPIMLIGTSVVSPTRKDTRKIDLHLKEFFFTSDKAEISILSI